MLLQKGERKKTRGCALIGARKLCFSTKEMLSWQGLQKPGLTHALASLTPVPPPAAAAAAYHCEPCKTLVSMSDPGRRRPPRSVAEVLNTGQLPDSFVRALSARF